MASSSEVFQRIVKVLNAECPTALMGIEPDRETALQGDLQVDSADLIAFMAGLEDEFGVRLEHQDLGRLETLGDLVDRLSATADTPQTHRPVVPETASEQYG